MKKRGINFRGSYMGVPKNATCLFCKEKVGPNDSFRNVNPETGEADYFHLKCFKLAVNNMIRETKEKNICQ